MTDEKLLEVIGRYEREVPAVLEDWRKVAALDTANVEALRHLTEMFPQMREFVRDGRREKLMRWLGWVQCVLFMCGVYTFEEIRQHNMRSEGEVPPPTPIPPEYWETAE